MTLQCPQCESTDVELTGTNGAEYPTPLVEHYQCQDCTREFGNCLTPHRGDRR